MHIFAIKYNLFYIYMGQNYEQNLKPPNIFQYFLYEAH